VGASEEEARKIASGARVAVWGGSLVKGMLCPCIAEDLERFGHLLFMDFQLVIENEDNATFT